MKTWTAVAAAWVLLLAGCGGGHESLEGFRERWADAVNRHHSEALYDLLDGGSRRALQHELEVMRGLPPDQQREVINQLGGARLESLAALTPEHYFALLWDRAMEGHRPTMTIEAAGEGSAYVVLALDGQVRQRFRLVREAGRWAWVLPQQKFSQGP